MRVRVLAAAAVSVVLLTACEAAGDEPAGLPDPTAAETTGAEGGAGDGDAAGDGGTEPTGDPATAPADRDWTLDVGSEPPEAPADLAVYEAYLAFWQAQFEAANLPDPAHQPLLDTSIDPQRQRVVGVVERLAADGLRTVGTLRIEPVVASVSAPTAAIQDCMDGRESYDVDAAGTEAPDSRGRLIPVLVQLLQAGSGWVVADVQEADHDCG